MHRPIQTRQKCSDGASELVSTANPPSHQIQPGKKLQLHYMAPDAKARKELRSARKRVHGHATNK